MKKALFTILSVLILDQAIKIWVKLNFYYGDGRNIIENWFDLQFVENPGMAFGWMIPGNAGKLTLSIFRIIVVSGIGWYLYKLIKQKVHWGYIISVSLIVAGALGNILDSAFYGLIFNTGARYDAQINDYVMYHGKAVMDGSGYAPFLMGNVVDMFHFTKVVHFPEWVPIWGGQTRELFPPVFNLADSAITSGIILIMLFQKTFFAQNEENPETNNEFSAPDSPDVDVASNNA